MPFTLSALSVQKLYIFTNWHWDLHTLSYCMRVVKMNKIPPKCSVDIKPGLLVVASFFFALPYTIDVTNEQKAIVKSLECTSLCTTTSSYYHCHHTTRSSANDNAIHSTDARQRQTSTANELKKIQTNKISTY